MKLSMAIKHITAFNILVQSLLVAKEALRNAIAGGWIITIILFSVSFMIDDNNRNRHPLTCRMVQQLPFVMSVFGYENWLERCESGGNTVGLYFYLSMCVLCLGSLFMTNAQYRDEPVVKV